MAGFIYGGGAEVFRGLAGKLRKVSWRLRHCVSRHVGLQHVTARA